MSFSIESLGPYQWTDCSTADFEERESCSTSSSSKSSEEFPWMREVNASVSDSLDPISGKVTTFVDYSNCFRSRTSQSEGVSFSAAPAERRSGGLVDEELDTWGSYEALNLPFSFQASSAFSFFQMSSILGSCVVEEASKSDLLISRFAELKAEFRGLFTRDCFEEVDEKFPALVPNVAQDRFLIVDSGECPALGTKSLGPCVAICGRAKDAYGKVFLGVGHNAIQDPQCALECMVEAFKEKGCAQGDVEFYLIGGWLQNDYHLDTQEQYLALAKAFNIKGVAFNLVLPDSDLDSDSDFDFYSGCEGGDQGERERIDVVLTADKILYSRDDFFFSLQGQEELGKFLG